MGNESMPSGLAVDVDASPAQPSLPPCGKQRPCTVDMQAAGRPCMALCAGSLTYFLFRCIIPRLKDDAIFIHKMLRLAIQSAHLLFRVAFLGLFVTRHSLDSGTPDRATYTVSLQKTSWRQVWQLAVVVRVAEQCPGQPHCVASPLGPKNLCRPP